MELAYRWFAGEFRLIAFETSRKQLISLQLFMTILRWVGRSPHYFALQPRTMVYAVLHPVCDG